MIHKEILVKGKVQGVYFRATAKSVADRLGIHGTVKNTLAGDVSIIAEGPGEAIEAFISWCEQGPPGARVTGLVVTEGPLRHYTDFNILRR